MLDPKVIHEKILFRVGISAPGVTPTTTNNELMQDSKVEMISGSAHWKSRHIFSNSTAGARILFKSSLNEVPLDVRHASNTDGMADNSK